MPRPVPPNRCPDQQRSRPISNGGNQAPEVPFEVTAGRPLLFGSIGLQRTPSLLGWGLPHAALEHDQRGQYHKTHAKSSLERDAFVQEDNRQDHGKHNIQGPQGRGGVGAENANRPEVAVAAHQVFRHPGPGKHP